MADIIRFPGGSDLPDEFDIVEEEEETLYIDPVKLQAELARIKSSNPRADIAIILEELDSINPDDIELMMEVAQNIEDESDMIEFDDDEE